VVFVAGPKRTAGGRKHDARADWETPPMAATVKPDALYSQDVWLSYQLKVRLTRDRPSP
jgi:hypothetical protein